MIPPLWILGGEDIDAPSGETIRRLKGLAADGRPIAIAVFPHAEHGIYEYETRDDGERLSTRQPDGYLSMMIDFIRAGRLKARYGTAVLQRQRAERGTGVAGTDRIVRGGPPRIADWQTWSGRERSSHSHHPQVPRTRLASDNGSTDGGSRINLRVPHGSHSTGHARVFCHRRDARQRHERSRTFSCPIKSSRASGGLVTSRRSSGRSTSCARCGMRSTTSACITRGCSPARAASARPRCRASSRSA